MNKIRNLKWLLSVLVVLFACSFMTYASAPTKAQFDIQSLNPFQFLQGVVFALSYGAGLSVILSVVVTALLLLCLSYLLYRIFSIFLK